MKALLLALFALLVAGAAHSEICDVSGNGSTAWTALATGPWTGCAPTSDDTFRIDDASEFVWLGGSVSFVGGIGGIVCSAGTLYIPAGVTLTLGSGNLTIEQDCTLIVEGEPRYEGRVDSQPTWTSSTQTTVATGAPLTDTTASDYLVIGDDDPADVDATLNSKLLHVGPGWTPRTYRMSPEKWRWYDIASINGSTGTILYNLEDATISGEDATAEHYFGTQTNPLTTPLAVTTTNVHKFGRYSAVNAGNIINTQDGDLGSYYVQFEEVTAAADPTECSGLRFKVVGVDEDFSGTDDKLWVDGDISRCTSGAFVVTRGIGRGDPIKIVRPATINGAGIGSILWTGGRIQARWARFMRLDGYVRGTVTPNLYINCNLCIYNRTGADEFLPGSYIMDSEIGWMSETTGGGDTLVLGPIGSYIPGSVPLARYPGVELDFCSKVHFERLYIHDTFDENQDGSGHHGFGATGHDSVCANRLRIERVTDDAMLLVQDTYQGEFAVRSTIKQPILYENSSTWANSQNLVDVTVYEVGTGDTHELARSQGTLRISGMMGMAADSKATISQLGARVDRSVIAGVIRNNNQSYHVFTMEAATSCLGSGTCPNEGAQRWPNRLIDSIVIDTNYDLTFGSGLINVAGSIEHSVIYGSEIRGATGADFDNVSTTKGVFVDLSPSGLARLRGSSSASDANVTKDFLFEDSVMVNRGASPFYIERVDSSESLVLRRFWLGVSSFNAANLPHPFAQIANRTASSSTLTEGLNVRADTADLSLYTYATGIDAGTTDVCIETTQTSRSAVFTNLNSTLRALPSDSGMDPANATSLRSFVAPADVRTTCERAMPRTLGLQNVGATHILLGDGFATRQETWSDKDLLLLVGAGGGGGQGPFPRSH